MSDDGFFSTVPMSLLRRGSMLAVQVGDREIVLCHLRDGQVRALDNICTHAFTRMSEGRLRGDRLICPLHGAAFDTSDGRVLSGPAVVPLPSHETRVVDEMIEVRIRSDRSPRR